MNVTQTRYDLVEIPSKGGSGIVCIARAQGGQEHAIKVLNLDHGSQKSLLSRARDEARMLSRLDHPNLVHVEPVLEVNGRQAIIMEYVRGANAEELLKSAGALPSGVAMSIIRDAALGLDAAWSTPSGSDNRPMQIIHRDIKPGNLMVSITGQVKVVDFGVAKASFDDRETQSAAFIPGSRGYMAPERYDGEDSPRGDVYGLGLTLMEMISGKKPVISLRWDKHDDDLGRCVDHMRVGGVDAIEGELRALMREMCAYEVDERPFMHDVAQRLDALLDQIGQPNMKDFAQRAVLPLFDARTRLPASEHPLYPQVRFLEADPETLGKVDIAAEVRKLVARDDFPQRAKELAALLATHPRTDITPLLALLDSAATPGWMFWARRPPHDRTLAALRALTPVRRNRVLVRAQKLVHHRDDRIAKAAQAVVDAASVR